MANLFSTKALRANADYLDFSTLVDNDLDYDFEDNANIEFEGVTYQDGLFVTTEVDGLYYVWAFGGTGFRFDEEGNALGGTVTGIVIFSYDPELDETTGVHLAVSGFKSSLTEIARAADTGSTEDDDAFWFRVLGKADVMDLSDEDDLMVGAGGNDQIYGNDGNDQLFGMAGNDTMVGGDGDDDLFGEEGNDILTGGEGQDFFYFETSIGKKNIDTVTDFDVNEDALAFNIEIFKSIDEDGWLSEDHFVVGAKALDSNDYFVYNNGTLFYDADGSGKGKAMAIVKLTGSPDLSADSLLMYFD